MIEAWELTPTIIFRYFFDVEFSPFNPDKAKNNKYVNPITVELPQNFRNINSNQELTNDENRLNIARVGQH